MDPGPESKLYSEDYDDNFNELEFSDWMNGYDSTSNGKEASQRRWPCWPRIQSIIEHPRHLSLPAVPLLFNTPRLLLCLASLFLLLLTFGSWSNIPVAIVTYGVELLSKVRKEFSPGHMNWLLISKWEDAVLSEG